MYLEHYFLCWTLLKAHIYLCVKYTMSSLHMELLFLRKMIIKAKPTLIVHPWNRRALLPSSAVSHHESRSHAAARGPTRSHQGETAARHRAQCCSTRGRHRALSVQPELPQLAAGQPQHLVPLGAGGAVHEEPPAPLWGQRHCPEGAGGRESCSCSWNEISLGNCQTLPVHRV